MVIYSMQSNVNRVKVSGQTDIQDIILKRRQKILSRKSGLALLMKIIILSLSLYLIFQYLFGISIVKGIDMDPVLKDGDLLIYSRVSDDYKTGDIVFFKKNKKTRALRIVALEGDKVDVSDDGSLLINGHIKEEEIFYPTEEKDQIKFPLLLKKNQAFVLGDLRVRAEDSRDFGPIDIDIIEGKVISLFRSRGI